MDKNEKGYFKKRTKQYGSKQAQSYLVLFDTIDKQVEFDEAAIKKKHFSSAKASAYSQTKSYLLDNLLKSLVSYHYGKSASDKITDLANSIKVLFRKKMRQESLLFILKAKKLAYGIDDMLSVIKMIHLQRSLMAETFNDDFLEKGLILEAEEAECIRYLKAQNELSVVYTKLLYMIRRVRFVANDKLQEELKEIMSAPILKESFFLDRPRGNTLYNSTMSRYYDFLEDFEKSFKHVEAVKKCWDAHPEYKIERLENYFSVVGNYCGVCWRARKPDKILPALESMMELKPTNTLEKMKQFESYHLGVLNYHTGSLKFDEYIPKIEPFFQEYDKVKDKLQDHFIWQYFYNASVLCLCTANYEKALEFLNVIFDDEEEGRLIGIRRVLIIENLILHYELGNLDSLPYYIKSSERIFRKLEVNELEMSFIRFMKKLVNIAPSEKKDLFQSYLRETENLQEKLGSNESIIQILDWKNWLKSVIQNKRIAEVMKEGKSG